MGIFTGKGQQVKAELEKRKQEQDGEKLDYKKLKINKELKKEGDSIRVRVLSRFDYTTYESHGSFEKGIWSSPCINPLKEADQRCLYCEASKHEGFEDLKSSTRFLFAFYDIDLEMLRYIDVSYNQGGTLIDDIDQYGEDLDDYAFTLKRQGSGTKTSYKLSPILKIKGEDKEHFDKADGLEVSADFFEKALYVRSINQQAIDLENHDFDVEGKLGYVIQEEGTEEVKEQPKEELDPDKTF